MLRHCRLCLLQLLTKTSSPGYVSIVDEWSDLEWGVPMPEKIRLVCMFWQASGNLAETKTKISKNYNDESSHDRAAAVVSLLWRHQGGA